MLNHGVSWRIVALPVMLATFPALADTPAPLPPGLPPPVKLLSPSAPLNAKEAASATMAAQWRNRSGKPSRGEDGSVTWTYGESLPSIVCSPLYTCDLALQPGEVLTDNPRAGDRVRWKIEFALQGSGSARTTHITIKPIDAGLATNLLIYTSVRSYSIKLISTQTNWTPLTRFAYPDDQDQSWTKYQTATVGAAQRSAGTLAGSTSNIQFYKVSGDNPEWRPLHAYTDGMKTYIQFPASMAYGEAPALLGLNDDGGLFHSPSERALRYRPNGTLWTVDGVEPRLELVQGVGNHQTKVELTRMK